jgi:Sugar (pentulose and hexulose) kinases
MTARDVLLAVDAGTTNIKAVALGTDGTELAAARRGTETLRPAPGRVEQEPSAVWEQTAAALGDVVTAVPDAADLLGVGLTGQGDGLWAVADDGTPVRNAVLWSDSRAADIVEEWEETGTLGELVATCGSAPYPGMSLPLLAWLAREEPAQFDRVSSVLSCKDWLAYRLTGERTLDHSEATVPYLDAATERYDRSVFDSVGLSEAHGVLPALSAPTEVVGRVTREAAAETGLDAGLPVVSGPFDVPASAIGGGAASPGAGAVTLGTSLTHQSLLENPRPATSGIQMALGIDGLWTCAIGSNAGTQSLDWAAGTVAGADNLAALADLAAAAPVGSSGVLYHPYLHTAGERGPFVDPTARAQFVGLTPEHGAEHLARAVYEGLSLAVRDCVEHLPEVPSRVALGGGGANSELWCQLVADCLDQPVFVPAGSEPGATGAAVVLGLAIGEYPSLAAAVERTVSTGRRYDPRADAARQYATLYDLFVDVREEMGPVWARRAEAYRDLDEP